MAAHCRDIEGGVSLAHEEPGAASSGMDIDC